MNAVIHLHASIFWFHVNCLLIQYSANPMSTAAKFGDDRKARVAHRSTAEQDSLKASLEQKRLQLAKATASINASKSPVKGVAKVGGGYKSRGGTVKKKKFVESDEEEEYMEESEEEEEEADMNLSDDEESERKRKTPAKRKPPVSPAKAKKPNPPPVPERKARTLSESSEEETKDENGESSGWLCKPRLQSSSTNGKAMKTRVSESPIKVTKRRQIVLSESDDEDDGKEEKVTNATSLKNVAKQAAKHKKKNGELSDSDYDGEEPDGDDGGTNYQQKAEDTPSSDSDGEDRRLARGLAGMSEMQTECVRFFNVAPREELLLTPRFNDKLADHLIANRPFDNYRAMSASMGSVRSGNQAVSAYIEHLEKRGVLEKILDDCKDHSAQVAADYKKCIGEEIELKYLTKTCSLHEYQRQGLSWLVMMHKKGLNCILGDEMGLGKTIQVIAFLAWCKEQQVKGPQLIIVPSSTVENWMNEIAKWCPDIELMTYYGNQDERKHIRHMVKKKKSNIDVLLTTYNMVGSKSDDKKFFKNFKINYVIYDEGHMLKNCGTERYRSLMKIKGSRKILLTGTPLQNNLIELISLMYFVMTRVFTKYCDDITQLLTHFKQQGRSLDSNSRMLYQKDRIDQAKAILEPYILRRLKENVLGSLPPKTDETVHVKMDELQSEMYDDQLELMRTWDGDTNNAYGNLMRLRQAANHPLLMRRVYDDAKCDKIARTLCRYEKEYEKKNNVYVAEDLCTMSDFQIHQICEKFTSTEDYLLDEDLALESGKCKYLDTKLPELKAKNDKVLIFSQFTQILDILEVYLKVREHSYCRLDGSTPVMERQEMINRYNNDSETFVFLLSTRAGGLGINLTSANHIIIHDIDFNPYNDKQAEDRCHRMGQKKPVHVIRLICKGTVEEGICRLARKKLQLEKEVTFGARGAEETTPEDGSELEGKDLQNLMKEIVKAKPTSPRKK